MIDNNTKISPFNKALAVYPEHFVGREDIILKIISNVKKIKHDEIKPFFILGEHGIGKTSLLSYMHYLFNEANMESFYVSNIGNDSVDKLFSNILVSIYSKLPDKTFNNVTSLDLKTNTKRLYIMKDIINNEFRDKDGLLILIDDIDSLDDKKELVSLYKCFANLNINLPVYMLVTTNTDSLDEINESLKDKTLSSTIDKLEDENVAKFLKKTFDTVDMTIEEDALNLLVKYIEGRPYLMQVLGDSLFLNCSKNFITKTDVYVSLIEIEKKTVYIADNNIIQV